MDFASGLQIRRSARLGTFNVFDFSRKQLEIIENKRMTEDFFIACVSLPTWFPLVVIDHPTYIDAVFISDANVEEAIRRGADEIWAIWTVSTKDEWRDVFVANYFQIIETTANTHFFGIWRRIEKSNEAIAAGRESEFGRPIGLKLVQAEVPLHYLINFSTCERRLGRRPPLVGGGAIISCPVATQFSSLCQIATFLGNCAVPSVTGTSFPATYLGTASPFSQISSPTPRYSCLTRFFEPAYTRFEKANSYSLKRRNRLVRCRYHSLQHRDRRAEGRQVANTAT